ncbi:hypothetical protein Pcinc_004724 [Petrolisthes cinctipes]|uniref:Uncharacterized protein n=1 Tax=Petrolisthes cinctipes TaxID=88211 RepID=A0AAE1L195_PETCI|nr:hypothetical protein Pcinc_004724 [Petrolisthes cinctipes]
MATIFRLPRRLFTSTRCGSVVWGGEVRGRPPGRHAHTPHHGGHLSNHFPSRYVDTTTTLLSSHVGFKVQEEEDDDNDDDEEVEMEKKRGSRNG